MSEDEEDASQSMAAAMGFSSFGAKPHLKRKYNMHTDAVTSTPPATGSEPRRPTKPIANAEEIHLDDEGEDEPRAAFDSAGPTETPSSSRPPSTPQALLPTRPQPSPAILETHGSTPQTQHFPMGKGRGYQDRAPWYEDYYDPMSNENPWAKLEKKMGLEAKGTWIGPIRAAGPATAS